MHNDLKNSVLPLLTATKIPIPHPNLKKTVKEKAVIPECLLIRQKQKSLTQHVALLERSYIIHYFDGCWREDKGEISPKWIQKLLANTAVVGVFCTFFNISLRINSI